MSEPTYDALGAEPFIRNILALVKEKQVAVLKALSGQGLKLEPFRVFNNSVRRNQSWPAFTAAPRTEDTPLTDDSLAVAEQIVIVLSIEIIHALSDDGNEIGYKLLRYARALRKMLNDAGVKGISEGVDPEGRGPMKMEISPTRYDTLLSRDETQLMKLATMILTLNLMEG
jgi:hypothetical protein